MGEARIELSGNWIQGPASLPLTFKRTVERKP